LILSPEQVQIITIAIIVWFLLFLAANMKLRRIPLEKRAGSMPKLMIAAAGASGALTLMITVLINMYFPQLLQEYSVTALYTTGIIGGAIFVWWTLYENYWREIKAIERKATEQTH
jgi:L-asparagine transporter-like permease